MFCPKCRYEYREGFKECSTCKILLVDELPSEPKTDPKFVEYEEILTTFNQSDIVVLKSLLNSFNIVYFFKGEHSLALAYPEVGAMPAKLMVIKVQADSARNILKDAEIACKAEKKENCDD